MASPRSRRTSRGGVFGGRARSRLLGTALLGTGMLAFAGCGSDRPTAPPISVSVSPAAPVLETGASVQLSASVSGTTNGAVAWRSSAPDVASVSALGFVTGVAAGTATVTATSLADARRSGSVVVTVLPPPVIVTVSPTSDTVNVGLSISLTAGVANTGNTAVTWRTSDAGVATVGATGLVTGVSAGAATITAIAQADTTRRASAAITVLPAVAVTVAPTAATLAIGGNQQLTALVLNTTNTAVTWRTSNVAVASVSDSGLVTAVGAGAASITAIAQADTTRRATAAITVPGGESPSISQITPATLTPGVSAQIGGTGFSASAAADTVTIDGVPAAVTAATTTQLTVVVPPVRSFPCAPLHDATVRLRMGGAEATRAHPLQAGAALALAPGDAALLTDDQAACSELAVAGGVRYLLTVANTSPAVSATARFRLVGSNGTAGSASTRVLEVTPPRAAALDPEATRAAAHYRLLEASRALAARLGRPPLLRPVRPQAEAALAAVGDTILLKVPRINAFNLCASYDTVRARVVYAGTRALVAEDVGAPLAGTMDSMFVNAGREFDDLDYPILTTYFGDPLAWDAHLAHGDGKLTMVFSPKVDASSVAGFAFAGDLYPLSQCASSNEREVFYGIVPSDTASGYSSSGTGLTRRGWSRTMHATVIHEAKHVASFAARFANNASSFEETWLEESTARLAEELYARVIYGYGAKQSVTYARSLYYELRPSTYGKPYIVTKHFDALYDYMAASATLSPLGRTAAGDYTFYGSGWSLVRWAIDQSTMDEASFTRALVQENTLTGTDNLAARLGRPFADMLRDWSLALATHASDAYTVSRTELAFPSWNLRDIFAGLNHDVPSTFPRAYPLLPTPGFGSFTVTVPAVEGGSASLFDISGSTTGRQTLSLQSASGGAPAPALRVEIVRVQ